MSNRKFCPYVGKYVIATPGERNYAELSITLTGDELWIDRTPWIRGKDSQRLIPISGTTFAGNFGRRLSFTQNDNGTVTGLVLEAPEPLFRNITALRQ